MDFFELPTEIRLKIYSELLVHNKMIVFVVEDRPTPKPLFRPKNYGLCPALLRISKRVHREASPLLYSNNSFRLPQVYYPSSSFIKVTICIAQFLRQIGSSQASLLHRICIDFPSFHDSQLETPRLHKEDVRTLGLVRRKCTTIRILELFHSEVDAYKLSNSKNAAAAIEVLDARLKAIPSLRKTIISLEVYGEEDPDLVLTSKMHDLGWAVNIIRLL